MAPYHYVLIFWALTLIYGLLRAFYEAGVDSVMVNLPPVSEIQLMPPWWENENPQRICAAQELSDVEQVMFPTIDYRLMKIGIVKRFILDGVRKHIQIYEHQHDYPRRNRS